MKRFMLLAVSTVAFLLVGRAGAADTYGVDPVHSSALFRAKHANTGYVWGKFKEISGTFVLDDADVTKDSFEIEIPVDSIDANNPKRDAHLKSPDFFNSKQYPTIKFKSTSVTKGEGDALTVNGNLDLHGVTKPISLVVTLVGKGEFPPGMFRAGLDVQFAVKLTDYQIKGMPGGVGDEIRVVIDVEGVKK